jgi:hypothetical protein
MPSSSIDLIKVVGRPNLVNLDSILVARKGKRDLEMKWPFDPVGSWKPGLRDNFQYNSYTADARHVAYSLATDGSCEMSVCLMLTERWPEINESWLVGGLEKILAWVERLKKGKRIICLIYIISIQFSVFVKPAGLRAIEAESDFGGQLRLVGLISLFLVSVRRKKVQRY